MEGTKGCEGSRAEGHGRGNGGVWRDTEGVEQQRGYKEGYVQRGVQMVGVLCSAALSEVTFYVYLR